MRQNLLHRYHGNEQTVAQIMPLLTLDPKGQGIRSADLIMLIKGHNLNTNQEVFAELEEFSRPDALLATQSATVPLKNIAAAMLKPERLIGMHFCFPAHRTELVELSYTEQTDPQLLERARALLCKLHKLPLLVKNNPGLLIDRILVQYILQGIRLNQQGVPHTVIDRAARDFGLPNGPLELADRMGLDYCLRVAEVLEKSFRIEIPYSLIEMVKTGKLGIKSGSGFYRYRNGNRLKPPRVDWEGSMEALQEKLVAQITEEAALCLEEGIIENPELIDAGIIFGAGFAPFLGGPLVYQRTRNKQERQGAS
ncbi:MAG: 3-hydroxyacyl-CoA dehydrogenase NAD-binding domain-containing protein [Thiolinea sp.]